MSLLLQLNAELPNHFPAHERRLYVFACRKKTCRRKVGSIRVLRGTRVEAKSHNLATPAKKERKDEKEVVSKETAGEQRPKQPSNLGETLFGAKTLGSSSGGSANPFSTSVTGSSNSSNPFASAGNPFSGSPVTKSEPQTTSGTAARAEPAPRSSAEDLPKTFAETLSLNNDSQNKSSSPPPAPEPWPSESERPPAYPISYLSDAEYETLDPTPAAAPPPTTTMDVDDSGGGSGKEDREVFESSMDATFQRFADRMAQNPEQAIRYEYGGQPLLYSKIDAVGKLLGTGTGGSMPRCANCGAARKFEVQLCPHAITELEAEELSLEGMDWGTVIIGVCEKDCLPRHVSEGQAGYLEEWAGVQWEELSNRR
jgi:pre-rRNA-processing protein TSR4